MQLRRRAFDLPRVITGGLLCAQLLWVLALAAMPAWHERLHPAAAHDAHGTHHDDGDRGSGESSCAVALFIAGACDCAPVPVRVATPLPTLSAERISSELSPVVLEFRKRGVLEHAPPRGV